MNKFLLCIILISFVHCLQAEEQNNQDQLDEEENTVQSMVHEQSPSNPNFQKFIENFAVYQKHMELQNARNQGINLFWTLFGLSPFGPILGAMIADKYFLSKEHKKCTTYGERMIARAKGACFPFIASVFIVSLYVLTSPPISS